MILDGKAIARRVTDEVRADVAAFVAAGHRAPGLAVVLVGENAASQIYVRNKRTTTETVGMRSYAHDLPATASEGEVLALIDRLNADPEVNAILVQLPLPKQVHTEAVIERIQPKKDVDGFHPYNVGRLVLKMPTLRPCTPYGCMRLLAGNRRRPRGQARRRHRPVQHRRPADGARIADGAVHGDDLPLGDARLAGPRAAGGHRRGGHRQAGIRARRMDQAGRDRARRGHQPIARRQACGDVEFAAARERASWITPVPGGVGPMTIATLLGNTLRAAQWQLEK